MKTRILFASLFLSLFAFSCTSKNDDTPYADPNPPITFKATLTGLAETPPNQSAATGSATLVLNQYTNILSGSVTFTGIDPTAGHIHNGVVGVAGPVVFALGNPPYSSPIAYTSMALDATELTDIKAGLYYVNLHTTEFPGGEIRGQLVRQ